MQLNPVSSGILVFFFVFISIALTLLLAGMAFLLLKMNRTLEEYRVRVDPLLDKADHMLSLTTEKVNSIGGKAEVILAQAEEVTGTVHEKVDRTTQAVQRTIHAPIIGINSVAAGLTRGWNTFSRLQQTAPTATPSPRDTSLHNPYTGKNTGNDKVSSEATEDKSDAAPLSKVEGLVGAAPAIAPVPLLAQGGRES